VVSVHLPIVAHRHFIAVTAMSPLQYQKQIRMQEARGAVSVLRRIRHQPKGTFELRQMPRQTVVLCSPPQTRMLGNAPPKARNNKTPPHREGAQYTSFSEGAKCKLF
jgi:hypothetical protein